MTAIARASLLALLAFCACDDTVVTPAGTVVLEVPAEHRLSVSDWSLGADAGPRTRVEQSYRWEPGDLGAPVRLRLAFEHGPFELVDASPRPDKPDSVAAPRAIVIEVVENGDWAITGRCQDDLSVPLAVRDDGTSAYPNVVWAFCTVVMKRKNGDITMSAAFEIYGDGKVDASANGSDHRLVLE